MHRLQVILDTDASAIAEYRRRVPRTPHALPASPGGTPRHDAALHPVSEPIGEPATMEGHRREH